MRPRFLPGLVLCLVGCTNTTQRVRAFAAADLQCPVGDLQLTESHGEFQDRDDFWVTGCHRSALYRVEPGDVVRVLGVTTVLPVIADDEWLGQLTRDAGSLEDR